MVQLELTFGTVFLIFALLVTADKALTVINIMQVQKNFPEAVKDDPYKIEKNPIAHWTFTKFGLFGGTAIYWFLSVLTLFAAFYFLKGIFHPSVVLYWLCMFYGFVIFNNLYFLLKYSRVVP